MPRSSDGVTPTGCAKLSVRPAERDVVRADGHRHVSPHDAAVEAVHAHRSVLAARDVGAGAEERDVLRRGAGGQPQQRARARRARRRRSRSARPTSPRRARRPGAQTTSCARNGGWIVRTSRGLRAVETSRTATWVAFVPSATHRRRPSALSERWRAGPGTCDPPDDPKPDEIDDRHARRASTRSRRRCAPSGASPRSAARRAPPPARRP